MGTMRQKLANTELELKTALEKFRSARTPQQKAQAKQKATNLLKKKKMYEAHLGNLQTTQYNVENAQISTEMMKDNMDIMNTMKQTVDVQKNMMKNMNVDTMYDMMDDMKDIQDQQEEMNEAMSTNYEVEVGDDELDAELDELDYQMRDEMNTKEMNVPDRHVLSKKDADEKELNDLLK